MIRLPKKIVETIKRELSLDYSAIKRIVIDSQEKDSKVYLIVLRICNKDRFVIVRYWADDSYAFLAGYSSMQEIREELSYQISRIV